MKATHPADSLIAHMENTEYNNRLTATKLDHWRTDRILTSDRRKSANDTLHKEKKLAHIDADGTATFYCDKFEAAAGRFISYNGANGEATITTAQDAAADRNAADLVDGFGGWFN